MTELSAGLLGVVAGAAVFGSYVLLTRWSMRRSRENATRALRCTTPPTERDNTQAGAFLFEALSPLAIVDYLDSPTMRAATAKVLKEARPLLVPEPPDQPDGE